MLSLWIEGDVQDSEVQEAGDRRVTDNPVQGLQNMPLHLGEHVVVVKRAAHGLELPNGGHTLLAVSVLRCDQESGTAYELVVSLIHDSTRAVAIQKIDREVQCFRQQSEGVMSFQKEIEQIRSHVPLNLRLDLDGGDVGHGLVLYVELVTCLEMIMQCK